MYRFATFRGKKLVTTIDGVEAVDCCYLYAGATGIECHKYTFKEMWLMYQGKLRMLRHHALWQTCLFTAEDYDHNRFILTGSPSSPREPLRFSPDTQAQIHHLIEEAKLHGGYIQVNIPDAPKRTVPNAAT